MNDLMPDEHADRIALDTGNRIHVGRADLARAVTNLWARLQDTRAELEQVRAHQAQPDRGSWLDAHTGTT